MVIILPRAGMEDQEDMDLLRDNGDSRLRDNGALLHNKATAAIKHPRNNSTITSNNNTTRPNSIITNNNTNNHTVSLIRATPYRKAPNASAMAHPTNILSNTRTVPESERPC